jgi:hypothetical protein
MMVSQVLAIRLVFTATREKECRTGNIVIRKPSCKQIAAHTRKSKWLGSREEQLSWGKVGQTVGPGLTEFRYIQRASAVQ